MRARRLPVLDEYVEQGRCAVLVETHVFVLSPVATEICRLLGDAWRDLEDVAAGLVELFGDPGEPGAVTMTRQALTELAEQRLVELTVA